MKNKRLFIELIDFLDIYEKQFPAESSLDIKTFAYFILNHKGAASNQEEMSDLKINVILSRDVSMLYRYSKFLIKKALKDSLLQTVEEHSYLATLSFYGAMSKTELNNLNVMEKTSGTEIIRRLLHNGLIYEQRNESDRRSLIVGISEKGEKALRDVRENLGIVADFFSKPLAREEKETLHHLNQRLINHNKLAFQDGKDCSFEEFTLSK